MLTVGDAFPAFSLPDQDGKVHASPVYAGKPFVVYFYPKDDTSGCTVEACEFRDATPDFGDIPVLGVSPDSSKSHRKFIDKHGLTFTLLADTEQALAQACGVWVEKSMYGKKYMGIERTTYLVNAEGKVAQVWNKVKPAGHAAEVLVAAQSVS